MPCEFFKISKNTFSYRTPPVAASVKATHTNNKINSNYLGDKLFLKNVYVIKVLAHVYKCEQRCVQRTGR